MLAANLNELDLSGSMVESIGEYAFFNNLNLKKADLGESLTEIGKCAFYGNSSLTELTIPDSVTTIGYRAYSMCSALKQVRIGANVAEIGEYAFSSCTALENIVFPGSVKSHRRLRIRIVRPLQSSHWKTAWKISEIIPSAGWKNSLIW